MAEFRLQIVTPGGLEFDDNIENLIVRAVNGDVGILARHADYVVPLEIGTARVKKDGKVRVGSCNGGTLCVTDGNAKIIAFSFEWADEIDINRALDAKKRAEDAIKKKTSDYELNLAKVKLKRALSRISVYENK